MQKILVYADTVDELRNQIVDDNLVNLLVSDNCLDAYLKENNRDKEEWWNEYVAEDTLDFYEFIKRNNWVYQIAWDDTDPEESELMKDADTIWHDDDIKGMLEFYCIEPTEDNVMKIASPEFIRGFHERSVEFGNEMIAARVREVFGE